MRGEAMSKEYLRKKNNLLGLDRYERAIIELSKWEPGVQLSASTLKLTGELENIKDKDNAIVNILEKIKREITFNKDIDKDKLYLSQVIELENPKFEKNNLILSPTGSGKTSFMIEYIKKNNISESLLLVSTTSLKDKLAPNCNEARKKNI